MEPKRILVNSDEYKTKGVFLYADDACNLYLDKEFTCAVTGEQLKDYFLLNAIIVHNGIMHLANNLIFGSKGGAKIAAIGSDLVFTSVDFEGDDEVWTLTWDGNTEGIEWTAHILYRLTDDVPNMSELKYGIRTNIAGVEEILHIEEDNDFIIGSYKAMCEGVSMLWFVTSDTDFTELDPSIGIIPKGVYITSVLMDVAPKGLEFRAVTENEI